ncbi:MAG: hypothetical protein LIP09_06940 [Bacteroidales bacterium]|nr:hypothetical protein [Bacteroidales bacterium]
MNAKALFLILALCLASSVMAQQQGMTGEEREKWLTEMRNYKHEVIAKELKLTKEQETEFFPIYDEMDDRLMQISSETRNLEAKVTKDADASDLECEAAARALYEQKSREGAVEMEYFDKFKEILSPKQLIRLKNAERKFTNNLLKHSQLKKGDKPQRNK